MSGKDGSVLCHECEADNKKSPGLTPVAHDSQLVISTAAPTLIYSIHTSCHHTWGVRGNDHMWLQAKGVRGSVLV